MKSLNEIYYSHKNWLDDEARPNYQTEKAIHAEMADEADQYVKELTSIKDNWKNVLKHDVSVLNPYGRVTQYIYTACHSTEYYFDNTFEWNDGTLESWEYKYVVHIELVEEFLCCLAHSVKRYFDEDIDLIGLVRQEAIDEEKRTDETPLDKLLEEWNALGIMKRVLKRLEEKGLATKNGKAYNWKIDNDNDYPNNLYVYFVYIASDKFGWRFGKNKDRIPWNKFNPLFPNMANNQNALNQYLIEIKNGIFPRRATEIDDIVK